MNRMKHWNGSILLCAALGGCSPSWRPKPIEAVDITSDYYHRARSGLFLPDREPLVLRNSEGQIGAPEEPYFGIDCEFGYLWVKSNEDEQLVVYVDESLFYSHVVIASEAYSARIFDEWPVHPVR